MKAQIVKAKERALSSEYQNEVRELDEQYREVYEREEIMYRQRSRVYWLKAGDQNTKYFQNRASHRKRKNTVKALRREDGTRCTDDDGMRELAASFYEHLFASEGSTQPERLLDLFHPVICEVMNSLRTAPISDDVHFFKWGQRKLRGQMAYLRYSTRGTGRWYEEMFAERSGIFFRASQHQTLSMLPR